jgi:hypothetical protein
VSRSERFELVDQLGRVCALLGLLAFTKETGEIYGVQLRDDAGQCRLEITSTDLGGLSLAFVKEGDGVLVLGVADAVGDQTDGPYIYFDGAVSRCDIRSDGVRVR